MRKMAFTKKQENWDKFFFYKSTNNIITTLYISDLNTLYFLNAISQHLWEVVKGAVTLLTILWKTQGSLPHASLWPGLPRIPLPAEKAIPSESQCRSSHLPRGPGFLVHVNTTHINNASHLTRCYSRHYFFSPGSPFRVFPERLLTSSKLLLSIFLIQINDDRVRTFLGFLRSTCGKGFLQGEESVHFVPHQQHPTLWHPISHHFSTSCHCPARVNRKKVLLLPLLPRKNSSQSKLCSCTFRSPYCQRLHVAASQGWPAAQGLSHHSRDTNCTKDGLVHWWRLNNKKQKFNGTRQAKVTTSLDVHSWLQFYIWGRISSYSHNEY